jgi:hypothetical protein
MRLSFRHSVVAAALVVTLGVVAPLVLALLAVQVAGCMLLVVLARGIVRAEASVNATRRPGRAVPSRGARPLLVRPV